MTNYHKSADGEWRRCRAVKREAGNGIEGCAIGANAHAIGRQGIADRGGGVIIEKRANGKNMVTTITPFAKTQTFQAISQSGKIRTYLADGRLLSKQEKRWLEEDVLWKKIRIPPSPRRLHKMKLHEESLKLRGYEEFRTYDFGNTKQNEERDIFVRWFDTIHHAGFDIQNLKVRMGDDNNPKNKEPDVIVHGDGFEKPLGIEIVQIFDNANRAREKNHKQVADEILEATPESRLDALHVTLDKKCSKKYAKDNLGYLVLLASDETGVSLSSDIFAQTKRSSMLFDEAWLVSGSHASQVETVRLGVNYSRESQLEKNSNGVEL